MSVAWRLLALLLLTQGGFARAQVIEIDPEGGMRVYDRPTSFTASGPTPIEVGAAAVEQRGPAASDQVAAKVGIDDVARAHGLSPPLLQAVAWQESRGRQGAVSPKGALGVMQLMPATAAELGVNPRDLADNLRGGALYLRRQLDRFGSVPLALAAYNAGPGAVIRHRGIPPYRETRSYVANILARMGHVAPAPSLQTPELPTRSALLIEVDAR